MRCLALLLLLLITPLLFAATGQDALVDSFPLGVYWPWERVSGLAQRCGMGKWDYVDGCLDDMKAHNINAVWVVNLGIADLAPLVERVEKRQMKIVPALAALHYNVPWRRRNWEYLRRKAQAAIEATGASDAILAWCLCDEPRKSFVDEMETYRQKFHEWGARRPAVVVTMWHDTPTYADRTDFASVCPDIYPFFSRGNPNGPNPAGASRAWYRRHSRIAGEAAFTNGKTAWIMPQAYAEVWGPWEYDDRGDMVMLPGAILHWRPPRPSEMRWQVWSGLAAGIRGFFWFCYAPHPRDRSDQEAYSGDVFPSEMAVEERRPLHFPGALIRPDGSATPQYEAAAGAFADIEPHIPLLKEVVPARTALGEVEGPGSLGSLYCPPSHRRIAVLVNDDPDQSHTLKVRLSAYREVRNLRTGETLRSDAQGDVAVELSAGDGTLLEVVR